MGSTRLSVIIPAHNEANLIGTLLTALVAADTENALEIVVVANGCTDATAAVARSVSPRITVIDLASASKVDALNAGDAATERFPRVYLDADVTVDTATLLALGAELDDDDLARAAAPRFIVDPSASSWAVRQYFAVWQLTAYRSDALIGAGIYALSRAGRARFGAFPELIADDLFVQQLFTPSERIVLPQLSFSVRAPKTLAAQMGRLTRATLGNEQLNAGAAQSGVGTLVRRVIRRPRLWPAFAIYCYVYLVCRRRARRMLAAGQTSTWIRDETTRAA